MLLEYETYETEESHNSKYSKNSKNIDYANHLNPKYPKNRPVDINSIGVGISQTNLDFTEEITISDESELGINDQRSIIPQKSQNSSTLINQHFSPDFKKNKQRRGKDEQSNPNRPKNNKSDRSSKSKAQIEKEINEKYREFILHEQKRILRSKGKNIPNLKLPVSGNRRSSSHSTKSKGKKYPPRQPEYYESNFEDDCDSNFEQEQEQGMSLGSEEETNSETSELLNQKNTIIQILKKKNARLKLQNKDLFSSQKVLNRQITAYEDRECYLKKKYTKLKSKMHEIIGDYHHLQDANLQLETSLQKSSARNMRYENSQRGEQGENFRVSPLASMRSPRNEHINVFEGVEIDNLDTFRDKSKDGKNEKDPNFKTFSKTQPSISDEEKAQFSFMKEKIEKQTKKIQDLQGKLEKINLEKLALAEKFQNHVEKFEDKLSELESLRNKSKNTSNEYEDIKIKFDLLEKQLELKNKQLDETRKELVQSQASIQNGDALLQQKIQKMTLEINQLQEDKLNTSSQKNALESEISELKYEIEELKAENQLSNPLNIEKITIEEVNILDFTPSEQYYLYNPIIAVPQLEDKSVDVSSLYIEDVSGVSLEDPNSMLTTQIDQLEKLANDQEAEFNLKMEAKDAEHKEQIKNLSEKYENLEIKFQELVTKNEELNRSLEQQQSEFEKISSELLKGGEKVKELELKNDELAKQNKDQQSEIEQLDEKLKAELQKYEDIEKEKKTLQLQLDKATEEYSKLDLAFQSMSANIQENSKKEQEKLQELKEQEEEENSKAKEEIEKLKSEHQTEIEELNTQINDLKVKLDEEQKQRTEQAQQHLEKINSFKSQVGGAQSRKKRFEELRSMREEEMTIDELAELDLSKYLYKVERQNQQLKADMVSIESEYEAKIKELASKVERAKLFKEDYQEYAQNPEDQNRLNKLKKNLIQKNKLIGDLRAQVNSLTEKVQKLTEKTTQKFESRESEEHTDQPENVPPRFEKILKSIKDKPKVDTEEGVNAQVLSFLTHKNAILKSRCRELQEQCQELTRQSESGDGAMNASAKQEYEEMKKKLESAEQEALDCQMKMSQQMMMVGELNDKVVVFANLLKKNKIPIPK